MSMGYKRAKEILTAMASDGGLLSETDFWRPNEDSYVSARTSQSGNPEDREIRLSGSDFSVDQLEAIALWVRNPRAVLGA